MNLLEIAKVNIPFSDQMTDDEIRRSFEDNIKSKLAIFNLKLDIFAVNNRYDFSETSAKILVELYDFKLKHFASQFKKDQLYKIDQEVLKELAERVARLLRSHIADEQKLSKLLLKVYAVEVEVGFFEDEVLDSLNLFRDLPEQLRKRAMLDIRVLLLEPFSMKRYPHLNFEDRNILFVDLINTIEHTVYEQINLMKEIDQLRITDKERSTEQLKATIEGLDEE